MQLCCSCNIDNSTTSSGPVCCSIGPWTADDSHLYVWHGAELFAYELQEPPHVARRTFEAAFAASGLSCKPQLAWLTSAGGVGGFATGGVVAVGADDLEHLTELAASGMPKVPPELVDFYRVVNPTFTIYTEAQLRLGVLQFLLAHELGHIRQGERGMVLPAIQLEANADQFAGWLSQKLRWDAKLGRIVARTIGCNGTACEHPAPEARVAHYNKGRAERRAQEASPILALQPPWFG